MKIIFTLILFPLTLAAANPIKNSKLNPAVEKPVVPGTQFPMGDMNTSPNPTPSDNESKKFQGTLKGRQLQEEEYANKEQRMNYKKLNKDFKGNKKKK